MMLKCLTAACLFAVVFCCGTVRAADITISAAVSLKEVLTDVGRAYERETGSKVQLNFAASGHLLAQIREGAPVDLFIAASDAQMDQAQAMQLVDPATRRVIATNTLVLIVPADAKNPVQLFEQLTDATVKRLAIGQPKTVPAGEYATQVLRHLKLDTALHDRLIYGESVRQVLDYVGRGEVSAGIVYATDAQQSGAKVRVVATADPRWHNPIRYVAAVVRASPHHADADNFARYLTGERARQILQRRGFSPATQPTTRP
jgi:molybdate transport system substrate-binding protein